MFSVSARALFIRLLLFFFFVFDEKPLFSVFSFVNICYKAIGEDDCGAVNQRTTSELYKFTNTEAIRVLAHTFAHIPMQYLREGTTEPTAALRATNGRRSPCAPHIAGSSRRALPPCDLLRLQLAAHSHNVLTTIGQTKRELEGPSGWAALAVRAPSHRQLRPDASRPALPLRTQRQTVARLPPLAHIRFTSGAKRETGFPALATFRPSANPRALPLGY